MVKRNIDFTSNNMFKEDSDEPHPISTNELPRNSIDNIQVMSIYERTLFLTLLENVMNEHICDRCGKALFFGKVGLCSECEDKIKVTDSEGYIDDIFNRPELKSAQVFSDE
jgi:hypothetical protein